jgi:hypothetical protein
MGGRFRWAEAGSLSIESGVPHATGATRIEFRSSDQDETREYVRRNHGEYSRVLRGCGQFLYRVSAVCAGQVIVGRTERWLHQTPHEFVTARRLAAARRRLERASAPVRISTIARAGALTRVRSRLTRGPRPSCLP